MPGRLLEIELRDQMMTVCKRPWSLASTLRSQSVTFSQARSVLAASYLAWLWLYQH
jgi:hypothetical protein